MKLALKRSAGIPKMNLLMAKPSESKRTLTLAFAKPNADDHWANHLTARASRHKVCHVELHFESINQCLSVQWGEIAGLRPKSLANPNYQLVSLVVTQKEYDLALEFSRKITTMQLGFDEGASWRAYCNPCACLEIPSQHSGRTFCSKLITECLQYAGLPEFAGMTPATTTPSRMLDAVLTSQRQACSSVPYKRSELVAKGTVVVNSMHPPPDIAMESKLLREASKQLREASKQ